MSVKRNINLVINWIEISKYTASLANKIKDKEAEKQLLESKLQELENQLAALRADTSSKLPNLKKANQHPKNQRLKADRALYFTGVKFKKSEKIGIKVDGNYNVICSNSYSRDFNPKRLRKAGGEIEEYLRLLLALKTKAIQSSAKEFRALSLKEEANGLQPVPSPVTSKGQPNKLKNNVDQQSQLIVKSHKKASKRVATQKDPTDYSSLIKFNEFVRSTIKIEEKLSLQTLNYYRTRYDLFIINIDTKHLTNLLKYKYNLSKFKLEKWVKKQESKRTNQSYSPSISDTTYPVPEIALSIPWSQITFDTGFFKTHQYTISLPRSQKSFNQLKPYLSVFRNTSLELRVDPKTQKVLEVKNAEVLDQVFDRLEIEQALTSADIKNPDYFARTLLGRWSNERLIRAYAPESRSLYLKHLCGAYSSNYRIVPVREHRRNESNDTVTTEDAFLFPIHGHRYVYILWESVEDKRATYVFRCTPSNYAAAVQKVFDYVASDEITNKRDRLRQGNVGYFRGSVVEYWQSLNHNDLNDWKRRLTETCW